MMLVTLVSHAESLLKDEKRVQRALLCPPGFVTPLNQAEKKTATSTRVDADQAQITNDQVTTFSGEVKIQQGSTRIEADNIRYDRSSEDFSAEGHVLFIDDIWRFEGNDAQINLNTNIGVINHGAYANQETLLRGDAKQVELQGKSKLKLTEATFTSCPNDNVAWKLSGPLAIEVEDRAYEGSLEARKRSLIISRNYLSAFVG